MVLSVARIVNEYVVNWQMADVLECEDVVKSPAFSACLVCRFGHEAVLETPWEREALQRSAARESALREETSGLRFWPEDKWGMGVTVTLQDTYNHDIACIKMWQIEPFVYNRLSYQNRRDSESTIVTVSPRSHCD